MVTVPFWAGLQFMIFLYHRALILHQIMNIIDICKIDPDDYYIDFNKNGVTDNGRSN